MISPRLSRVVAGVQVTGTEYKVPRSYVYEDVVYLVAGAVFPYIPKNIPKNISEYSRIFPNIPEYHVRVLTATDISNT